MLGPTLGSYRIDRELGSGGMGTVYLATSLGEGGAVEAGTRVALKVIHANLVASEGVFRRFQREAEMGLRIVSDHVVRTYAADVVEQNGTPTHFLVMEHVEGRTLRALLEDLEQVPEELCLHVGREVAAGLQAIHDAGIVHRDLKPENVMITPDHVVKVMDLGVAKLKDEVLRLSRTGQFVGSLHYAAPEQFRSTGDDLDGRADLFALGVVLHELAAGTHPFAGDSYQTVIHRVLNESPDCVSQSNPQVSPFFDTLVETLLAKERDDRFASPRALLDVIAAGEGCTWWQERERALRGATRRPLRRIRIPRETALHGRESDLAVLHEGFRTVRTGAGRVVLLEGEAGVGKTRLVDEFLRELERGGDDVDALVGTYPPGGAATAAGAFVGAYRERLGPGDLESTLDGLLLESPLLAPALAALLRGEGAPAGSLPLTTDALQTALIGVTRSLASSSPVVLTIEDLHLAPAAGLALFAALAVAIRDHPVLLVGTMRPGVPPPWRADMERMEHTRSLTLARLESGDVQRILEEALGTGPLVAELAAKVASATGGVPYFVFEILRSMREQGVLRESESGIWVMKGIVRDLTIPSSVEELLKARIADLQADDRTFLEVAACLGDVFDPLLVAKALDEKPIPALQRLARLEAEGRLVCAKGRAFAFDHGQVRTTLYEGTPELLREQYHALLGATLEAQRSVAEQDPASIPGDLAVDLLRHFLLGDEPTRGRRYFDRALAHLEGVYGHVLAADLSERALATEGFFEDEARAHELLAQSWRLDHLGRREEQRAAIDEVRSIAERLDSERYRLLADKALGGCLWRTGEVEAACEAMERAAERAAAAGDRREQAALLGNVGTAHWSLGNYESALELQRKAVEMAQELGLWSVEANAVGGLGNVLWALGRHEEALDAQRRWLALAKEHGDRVGEAMAEGNIGGTLRFLGRRDEARPPIERSLELARRIGHPSVAANAATNLGGLCGELGRLADSIVALERALGLLRDIRYRETEGVVQGMLGHSWLELGVVDRAREHYDCAYEVCTEISDPRNLGHAIYGHGLLAALEGDKEVALERYGEAIRIWTELGYPRGLAPVYLDRGILLDGEGRRDEAETDLRAALASVPDSGEPGVEIQVLGRLALHHGGEVDAVVEAFAKHEPLLSFMEALSARFLLWKLTKDPAHLAEAARRLDHLVEHAPEACRASMRENVPLYREIEEARRPSGTGSKG